MDVFVVKIKAAVTGTYRVIASDQIEAQAKAVRIFRNDVCADVEEIRPEALLQELLKDQHGEA